MDFMQREEPFEEHIAAPVTWNRYLLIAFKFILLFYILTLFMEDYFLFAHQGQPWTAADFIMGILYVLIIIMAGAKMIKKLPLAAILLAAPTIPLMMLILAIASLPVLQHLHKNHTTVHSNTA